jgi:hypothetical protein
MARDNHPQVPQATEEAIEPAARNVVAMRDDLVEGANFYIRAVAGIEPPDRGDVVAWLERFAEHGHRSDEFRMLGLDESLGDEVLSPAARRLHTALASSMALLLSSDEQARETMLTVDELMERMETPEVIGRWED